MVAGSDETHLPTPLDGICWLETITLVFITPIISPAIIFFISPTIVPIITPISPTTSPPILLPYHSLLDSFLPTLCHYYYSSNYSFHYSYYFSSCYFYFTSTISLQYSYNIPIYLCYDTIITPPITPPISLPFLIPIVLPNSFITPTDFLSTCVKPLPVLQPSPFPLTIFFYEDLFLSIFCTLVRLS